MIAPVSHAVRPAKAPGQSAGKGRLRPRAMQHASRVTNGSSTLPGVDGRTAIARRYHDICAAIAADQGGVEHMSEARLQLVRRFAAAACIAEEMEACLANGEDIDVQRHAHLCSTMVRIVSRIGINRRLRNITPTLAEYLDQRAADEANADSVVTDDEEAA